MTDDRFDMWLEKEAREHYNQPPATPRDVMWQRIQAARTPVRRAIRPRIRPVIWVPLAAAALLVVGVGIGWLIKPDGNPAPIAQSSPAPPTSGTNTAYRLAATQFLGQSEVFLTGFREETRRGVTTPETGRHARQLLATSRLLLDSPAASDARLKSLLEELELVLSEISTLTSERAVQDAPFITEGLDARGLLPRLRTAVPAGPLASGT